MTPAEVLRGAAAKIEERGWFQGTDMRSDLPENQRPLCANLAMDAVVDKVRSSRDPVTLRYVFTSPEVEARYHAFVAAQSCLITFLGLPPRDIPIGSKVVEWNDAPGRTKTEVVASLRSAADTCR